jgi:hypothetical protein
VPKALDVVPKALDDSAFAYAFASSVGYVLYCCHGDGAAVLVAHLDLDAAVFWQ